jgi:hypothetical protein
VEHAAIALIAGLMGAAVTCLGMLDILRREVRRSHDALAAALRREGDRMDRRIDELVQVTDGCKTMTEHAIHVAVAAERAADHSVLRAQKIAERAAAPAEPSTVVIVVPSEGEIPREGKN